MLSYRHAFHAGNHADVLKHIIWISIINYFKRKDSAFYVHDTHAGAGIYDISSDMMQKKKEFQSGIAALYDGQHDNMLIKEYVDLVKSFNADSDGLNIYPGSPLVSAALLREQDRMSITDLHSTEFPKLKELFKGNKQVKVHNVDAYEGLLSMTPPKERRGAVLIDPSYEIKDEYATLVQKLGKALTKFPTGVYAIWYPVLARKQTENYINALKAMLRSKNQKNEIGFLRAELSIAPDREDGYGMVGSGMFIVNPPYVLKQELEEVLPILKKTLAPQEGQFILQDNK